MLGLITSVLGGLLGGLGGASAGGAAASGIAGAAAAGAGEGFLSTLASTGLQLLPSILQQRTQRGSSILDESFLDLKNTRDQLKSEELQAMMTQRARQTVQTARSLMANSGFRQDVGSQNMFADQSFLNLDRNLSMERLVQLTGDIENKISKKQRSIKGDSDISPVSSKLFETTLQPMLSSGIKSLGGMLNLF